MTNARREGITKTYFLRPSGNCRVPFSFNVHIYLIFKKVIDRHWLSLLFHLFKCVLVNSVLNPVLELQKKKMLNKNRHSLALKKFKF